MPEKSEDLIQAVKDTGEQLSSNTARKQMGLPTSDTLSYKATEAKKSGKQFASDAADLAITAGKKTGQYIQKESPGAIDHILRNKEAYGAAALGGLGYFAYKKWKKNRGSF